MNGQDRNRNRRGRYRHLLQKQLSWDELDRKIKNNEICILPGQNSRNKFKKVQYMKDYEIPNEQKMTFYNDIFNNNNPGAQVARVSSSLTGDNYCENYHRYLYLEETAQNVLMRQYDIEDCMLTKESESTFIVPIPSGAEDTPYPEPFSKVYLFDYNSYVYEAQIEKIHRNAVFIRLYDPRLIQEKSLKFKKVVFNPRHNDFRQKHHVVDLVGKNHFPQEIIFPSFRIKMSEETPLEQLSDFLNQKLNPEQRKAVSTILTCGRPAVLLVGPSWEKMDTLVEAILRLHKKKPKARILVCSNSNNSTDTLAVNILLSQRNALHCRNGRNCHSAITRLVTFSRENDQKCVEARYVFPNPNRRETFSSHPLLDLLANSSSSGEDWRKYSIVVTTIRNAGKILEQLSSSGEQSFFDGVFIEGAASIIEPECLIPIAVRKENGICVLADDRGKTPWCYSKNAKDNDLSRSLLERHIDCPLGSLGCEQQSGVGCIYIELKQKNKPIDRYVIKQQPKTSIKISIENLSLEGRNKKGQISSDNSSLESKNKRSWLDLCCCIAGSACN